MTIQHTPYTAEDIIYHVLIQAPQEAPWHNLCQDG